MLARHDPEEFLETALSALSRGPGCWSILDALPVPVYTTDAKGAVTYWNRACVKLAGREPALGKDRWCVTWKLYRMTGERLPHDRCPMAETIRQKRPIREAVAIAERPDGSRVALRPYPAPLFDNEGNLTGAVNVLIDVTSEQSRALHQQADHCRRLADATYDRQTSKVLGDMADGFDRTADGLGRNSGR